MPPDVLGIIRAFYAASYWESPHASTVYQDGFVLSYSGKQWQSGANQLWIDQPERLDSLTVARAAHFFRPWLAEWSLLVIPELQPALYAQALQLGAYPLWTNPVMLATSLPTPALPPDLSIQPIHQPQEYDLAYRILCESYQLVYSPQQNLFRPCSALVHYLAHYQGYPAAIGSLNTLGGWGGIWNVATRPLFRRRGLAWAMMSYLGQQTQQLQGTILLASSAAYGLYLELGYQVIGTAHYMAFNSY
jgi:GNAT superfamily N-acetyltransferase